MKKKWLIAATAALTLTAGNVITPAAAMGSATADSIKYSNNGQAVTPSSPALEIDGHLYLPLRALSEAASKYVDWDELRNNVALTDTPHLTGKYKLSAPNLADGIKMGIGSSLTHLPGDPDNVFYSTADRGPNGEIDVNGKSRRTFPLADYTPSIYKIEINKGEIKILEQMTITDLKARGILPPAKRTVLDAAAFDYPYEKIEGLALVNGDTLVIVNDNDFGVGSTSPDNGTELWTFKLPYTVK